MSTIHTEYHGKYRIRIEPMDEFFELSEFLDDECLREIGIKVIRSDNGKVSELCQVLWDEFEEMYSDNDTELLSRLSEDWQSYIADHYPQDYTDSPIHDMVCDYQRDHDWQNMLEILSGLGSGITVDSWSGRNWRAPVWYFIHDGSEGKDEICRSVIKTVQQWAEGEIYGFIIEKPSDEYCECVKWQEVDSCWMFLGYNNCLEYAREEMTAILEADKQAEETAEIRDATIDLGATD